MCAGEKRMIELDLARVCRIRPVGDDAAMAEFPDAVALLVLVEVTTADQHIEKTLVGLHLMHRDQVDLALGANTVELQVDRRDIVMQHRHRRLDLRQLVEELTGRRSEEHTSELTSLMRTSYAVFCL